MGLCIEFYFPDRTRIDACMTYTSFHDDKMASIPLEKYQVIRDQLLVRKFGHQAWLRKNISCHQKTVFAYDIKDCEGTYEHEIAEILWLNCLKHDLVPSTNQLQLPIRAVFN